MSTLTHIYSVEIDKIDKAEWTDTLTRFDDANIYQTWDYGAERWGNSNLGHLVLRKGNDIVAACQLKIIKIPVIGSGIAYVKWGPMWQPRGKKNDPANFQEIVRALRNEYIVKRGLLLRIVPNQIREDTEIIYSILQAEGLNWSSSIIPYETLVLDLSPSLDELRRSLKKKWRQNLGHAERSELKVTSGVIGELFDVATALYNEMLSRKKFIDSLNLKDLSAIQNYLVDDMKMQIMICELHGEPIAARVVSHIGDSAIDFIAATGNKGISHHASYLLQWRIIEWLKLSGCRWYDLGGIDTNNNPGGYQFKSGIVGENGRSMVFREFNGCQNELSSLFVKIGDQLGTISSRRLLEKIIKMRL